MQYEVSPLRFSESGGKYEKLFNINYYSRDFGVAVQLTSVETPPHVYE
jgi:hypothetical protein